jgi:hypothetical protein
LDVQNAVIAIRRGVKRGLRIWGVLWQVANGLFDQAGLKSNFKSQAFAKWLSFSATDAKKGEAQV